MLQAADLRRGPGGCRESLYLHLFNATTDRAIKRWHSLSPVFIYGNPSNGLHNHACGPASEKSLAPHHNRVCCSQNSDMPEEHVVAIVAVVVVVVVVVVLGVHIHDICRIMSRKSAFQI